MAECPIILTNSHIIVGDSSDQGADVAMTGSIQIDDTGATSINPSSTDAIPETWTATTQSLFDGSGFIATNEYADRAAATSIFTQNFDDTEYTNTHTDGTLDQLGSPGGFPDLSQNGDGFRLLCAGFLANPDNASTAIQQRIVAKLDSTIIFDSGLLKIEDGYPSGVELISWCLEIDITVAGDGGTGSAFCVSRFKSNAMLDKTSGYSQEAKAPLCQFATPAINLTTGSHAVNIFGSSQGSGAAAGDVALQYFRSDQSTSEIGRP